MNRYCSPSSGLPRAETLLAPYVSQPPRRLCPLQIEAQLLREREDKKARKREKKEAKKARKREKKEAKKSAEQTEEDEEENSEEGDAPAADGSASRSARVADDDDDVASSGTRVGGAAPAAAWESFSLQ